MKNQSISYSGIQIANMEDDFASGDIFLPANQTFILEISYPCKKTEFKIKTGTKGMGSLKLFAQIGKSYKEIYKKPALYGVYGHGIRDLFLEGVQVDFVSKRITLHVGS